MANTGLTDLEQSILRTVAWFSLFDYPLTHFEVWKWLLLPGRSYSLADVEAALRGLIDPSPFQGEARWGYANRLVFKGAWVALASGGAVNDLVEKRHARFLDATRKLKKLKRAARWFAALGSVRAVAACNTLGWYATGPESDIDVFVIVRPGTLWLTRLLIVVPFLLLGKRPMVHEAPSKARPFAGQAATARTSRLRSALSGTSAGQARDPYCFSFFLSSAALDLESLRLPGGDPYLAYWLRSLVPILDRDGLFERLREANSWVRDYLPNSNARPVHAERAPRRKVPALVPLFGFLDRPARFIQVRRFPQALRDLMNRDSRVVISDAMLKFHANDRRAEFRNHWHAACALLGVSTNL